MPPHNHTHTRPWNKVSHGRNVGFAPTCGLRKKAPRHSEVTDDSKVGWSQPDPRVIPNGSHRLFAGPCREVFWSDSPSTRTSWTTTSEEAGHECRVKLMPWLLILRYIAPDCPSRCLLWAGVAPSFRREAGLQDPCACLGHVIVVLQPRVKSTPGSGIACQQRRSALEDRLWKSQEPGSQQRARHGSTLCDT